jgi:hypothetical protein
LSARANLGVHKLTSESLVHPRSVVSTKTRLYKARTAFMSPPTVWPSLREHCSVASPRSDASGTIATNEMMKSAVDPFRGGSASERARPHLAALRTPLGEVADEAQRDGDEQEVDVSAEEKGFDALHDGGWLLGS